MTNAATSPTDQPLVQHPWAFFELARLQLEAGDLASALSHVEGFLASHRELLPADTLQVCERILDSQFDQQHDRTLLLYRRLATLGSGRHRTVILAFESLLQEGDLNAAVKLLPIMGRPSAAWEHRILVRYYLMTGDNDKVEHHTVAAGLARPDSPALAVETIGNLFKIGRPQVAPRFLDRIRGRLPPEDEALLDVGLRTYLPEVRVDVALACGSSFATASLFVEFLRQGEASWSDEERARLYAALLRRFPGESELLRCLANLEMRRRNFDAALEFGIQSLDIANSQGANKPALRFEVFEIACHAGRFERARTLLEGLAPSDLSPQQQLLVLRFFAELGEWAQALRVIELLLELKTDFPQDQVFLIVRVARRARGQYQLLKALAGKAEALSPSQKRIAAALYEDWVVAEGAEHPEAQPLANGIELALSPLLSFKLAALAPKVQGVLASHTATSEITRRAIFYCADSAYILPAMVSLSTLLSCNPGFRDAVFYLVIDDELVAETQPVLERLRRHYGVRISAQTTSGLIPADARLRTSYGMFTGGQRLAAAAYYRIFMALKLAESAEFDQLLYVDSDSVISHGFDGLLALESSDTTVVMARVDEDTPAVRQATRRHGLEDGGYFNSGVLWFPRVNGELVTRLRMAESVARERSQELMFQDQCALNIAFAGAAEPLPERFNFFTGPKHVQKFLETPAAAACMFHMVDRLKPWDSAYPQDSPIQTRWLNALRDLQRLVGREELRPLLARTCGRMPGTQSPDGRSEPESLLQTC